jgi:hypothetical protein
MKLNKQEKIALVAKLKYKFHQSFGYVEFR